MTRLDDRDQFLRDFRREVNDCVRVVTTQLDNQQVLGDVLERLSALKRDLLHSRTGDIVSASAYDSLLSSLNRLVELVSRQAEVEESNADVTESFASTRVSSRQRGSPKFNITRAQLEFLIACRFSQKKIAEILHVSSRTVSRRFKEFNLDTEDYSDMSTESLDETVQRLLAGNHRIGANTVVTLLHNEGIKVQRERVRESVRRVDPAGVACRSRRVLKRRAYKVHCPNSLWHLDGNHKLIRWRIVVHAGVDGFSRLITFMKASTDNRASTVFELFKEATKQYGTPSRIRCDNGGENTAVCQFMEEYHGTGRGSAIRGRSVHNQRVERNWLEMWNGCINVYYDLFTKLEEDRLLNPNSEEQLFALHYVYLPSINHALKKFVLQWNHHKMRTEHSSSPLQMFVMRSLEVQGSLSTAVVDMWENATHQDTSIDTASRHSDEEDDASLTYVDVPTTVAPITDTQLEQLRQHVNPMETSENFAVDMYLQALHVISEFH
ncbi:uncharacterized protein [Apostichopus japonicus]|uniref:uncharacterized protein n=1 Tax=Stichopus japonicus TaxID=307972 RepID=UPI003AB3DE00